MKQKLLLFGLLTFFLTVTSYAQGIRGRVVNEMGQPVAFATIYVPKTSTGTLSNADGSYELKLQQGNSTVEVKYLGYQTQSFSLNIGPGFQERNIVLETQNYRIPEVKVTASGEDPAYYIMRRAIAMTPYYQKQVSKYTCKVYLKASGIFEKVPFFFDKYMKKAQLVEGEPFVTETFSKITFELPDNLSQQVVDARSAGRENDATTLKMTTNNLYNTEKYGVISPLGKNGLKSYNFSLAGTFEDQGRTINKILVIPKVDSYEFLSGYLYIADDYWNIHSADLHMRPSGTEIQFRMVNTEVAKNVWMPVGYDFDFGVAGMGFKIKYKYMASLSEYQVTLNPSLDHSFLDKIREQQLQELAAIEEAAGTGISKSSGKKEAKIDELMAKKNLSNSEAKKLNRLISAEIRRETPPEPLEIKSGIQFRNKPENNDSAYWAGLRSVPLTAQETKNYAKEDSLLIIASRADFQNSDGNDKRQFKIKHLLFGKNYDYSEDTANVANQFSIPGIVNPGTTSFNSVDGLRIELPSTYTRTDTSGHLTRLRPTLGYAFVRKKLDASLSLEHRLNGLKNTWISISGGTTTSDFNRTSPLSVLTNDFYTLWLEENYKRYYRRDFGQIQFKHDLANGLTLSLMADYSNNMTLRNHTNYSFLKYEDKQIQPNIPENKAMEPWQISNHQSLVGRVELEYTPRYRYQIKNHAKTYVESRYPTFNLIYRSGISGIAGSDSRYDLLKAGARQQFNFGIGDFINYQVVFGSFLNHKSVYFEDFQHFNSQTTGFSFAMSENSYKLLPFYKYSTQKSFAEFHGNLQTRRLVVKLLPGFRSSTVLREALFVNALFTPEIKNYVEVGYGLHNLLSLLNVDAVAGFENGAYRSAGIKVSMNLK